MRDASEHHLNEAGKGAMRNVQVLPLWMRRLGFYGLALLFVAAAAALRWMLPGVLGPIPFLVFYLAWVGAAAFGGLGPGLLATVASWLCIELLFNFTPGRADFADPTAFARLAILVAGGLTVSLVAERMRRGRIRQRRSEQWFRTLANAMPQLVWTADPDGRVDYYNDRYEEFQGIRPTPDGTFHWAPVLHEDDRTPTVEAWERAVRTGETYQIEHRVQRADGSYHWYLSRGIPVRDSEGRIVKWFGTATDIDSLKRAEEALRRSEAKFRQLFDSLPLGATLIDPRDYTFVMFNDAAARSLGYGPEEFSRLNIPMIEAAHDESRIRENLDRLLAGERLTFETQHRTKSGERRDFSVSAERIDIGGRPLVLAISVDVTVQKETERQLRELTATLESRVVQRTAELKRRARQLQKLTLEMSEAEDRERERIAHILHDDLQQLLAAAKFHLSLMRSGVREDAALHGVGEQIDGMLKEAIAKSRSLSHELSPAVLHHGNFAETLEWLANQMHAKHGLVVHVQAHDQVHLESAATRAFLYKVTQELLFNVVKHARVAEARIRVRRLDHWVYLSVADRGQGFDPEELGRTAGFGLLSIRERVELLGGRMKVRSAKGKGSTFLILAPDGEVESDPSGRAQSRDTDRLRVLLADDHEIVRDGLASLLSDESDVEVIGGASNGREAVDLTDRLRPDVVIMDVAMPLMSGDEATRQIKEHRPSTRVVALSMSQDPDTVERMHQAGADSYVLKTAPSEELLAAIRGD